MTAVYRLIVEDGEPRIVDEEEIMEDLYNRIDYLDYKIQRLLNMHEKKFDITQDDIKF